MSANPLSFFSHSHHLLAIRGCTSQPDVLAFRGEERLSEPFRWRIEFTSPDHGITREAMLMKPASLTLPAVPPSGLPPLKFPQKRFQTWIGRRKRQTGRR